MKKTKIQRVFNRDPHTIKRDIITSSQRISIKNSWIATTSIFCLSVVIENSPKSNSSTISISQPIFNQHNTAQSTELNQRIEIYRKINRVSNKAKLMCLEVEFPGIVKHGSLLLQSRQGVG